MPDESGTPVDLKWYVTAIGEDEPFAQQCAAEAEIMVGNFVGATEKTPNPYNVPDEVLGRAVLEVGADLYYRKASRNGIASFDTGMPAPEPMRLNRDPMAAAFPILRPFMPAPGL
jgi:hypothetical protein